MKYELNEQVINNLKAFLNRVDLKGSEVPAYISIMNAINNPIQIELEDNNNNNK